MTGYDRPLKPEWIHKTLCLMEPGKKPEDYYQAYEDIAVELTGKDGRRKTRTVLFRTFIYNFQKEKAVIENNFLMDLSKRKDCNYMKPLYLSTFVLEYEILRYFTRIYWKIFDASQEVSSLALTRKMIENYGDSEIVKRSTRAFLKTLTDFGLIEPKSTINFEQFRKTTLSDEQVADILQLYSIIKHTKQINIKALDRSLFGFYNIPELSAVANRFHTVKWEYIKGIDRELLMMA